MLITAQAECADEPLAYISIGLQHLEEEGDLSYSVFKQRQKQRMQNEKVAYSNTKI